MLSATGIAAPKSDVWSIHGQTTFVDQYAPPFRSPYVGQNSLIPNQTAETWDVTFYAGLRLWQGAEFWFNPEIDQGFGLSGTVGVAGFPSGESYKVGAVYPYARLHRMFIRQTIDLGGKAKQSTQTSISSGAPRPPIGSSLRWENFRFRTFLTPTSMRTIHARTFSIGRSSIPAHSIMPRTRGPSLMEPRWNGTKAPGPIVWVCSTFRSSQTVLTWIQLFSSCRRSVKSNGAIEFEGQPGKIAMTGFLTRGRLGKYSDAVLLAAVTGGTPSLSAVSHYTSRTGISFNAEQQIVPDIGFFARAGYVSPNVQQDAFTDMTATAAAGFAFSGNAWGRPGDSVGIAGVVNSISKQAQAYFNAGGLGALVGDGKLPKPGPEEIIETYYTVPIASVQTTLDYQFINNPAYNEQRGPVSVIGR